MINLRNLARGKADLVSVCGKPVCSAGGNPALLQTPGHGFFHRRIRVCAAGYAHGLVRIGTAGQNIANRAAKAGGRAAKRLNFRRMVMRFVFKFQQPFFRLSIHFNVRRYAACVDFVALVQIVDNALIFQRLGTHGAQIHQGMRALRAAGCFASLFVYRQRLFKRRAHRPLG